ncbi:MAG: hypothetical protein H6550_05245 [Chitinophagales bacterium]|nr:hypothetical protein [Chitinophagales bacterium]
MKKYRNVAVTLIVVMILPFLKADAQSPRTTVINRTSSAQGRNGGTVARTIVVNKQPAKRKASHIAIPARTINTLPGRTTIITHRSIPYYCNSGMYYRKTAGRYILTPAPIGLRMHVLPVGYRSIVVGPTVLFNFGSTFYRQDTRTNDYEVVAPPAGGVIYDLPDGAQEMTVGGKIYYEYNGTLYKKIETADGWAYEVAGGINDNQ